MRPVQEAPTPDTRSQATTEAGRFVLPAADRSTERPAQIGRYAVQERLGRGGMGVVYAAYDPELDRKVAIKLIYGDAGEEQLRRSQEQLRREAQALAKLAHPNIVAIHDVGVHAGQVFVAMEFVAGRTMREWWEERAPGWQEVLAAMVQAGRGIVAAHAVGLIHRDIKPDNLLIGDDGRVRVADFGIARHDPSVTEPSSSSPSNRGRELGTIGSRSSVIGTPAYMPPEQHEGGHVGPHSDQFSFCVTLWEGLHGQRPFVGEPRSLADIIRAGAPSRPAGAPDLPGWLDRALLRGLSARIEDRWPSMQALLDVLALDFDARRARRRRRALYAALAVVGCVALVLGGRALQAHWAREANERVAALRLISVNAGVERMLARGMRAEAEEALRTFVQEPGLRDTSAAIDAWLKWADHMDAAGDRAAAQAAAVEAYTALSPDDPREPAIALRIARQFRGAWKFDELAALGEQVAARWPEEARSPAWAEMWTEAALARGDLAGFLARVDGGGAASPSDEFTPALRALATARCPVRGKMAVFPTDWPGSPGPEVVIFEREFVGDRPRRQSLRRMDADLTPLAASLDDQSWNPIAHVQPLVRVPGGPAYLVGYRPEPTKEVRLFELGVAGTRELLRWTDDGARSSAVADLDGDGARELYVGTAAYTRKLYRLEPDAQGEWQRRSAHPPTDAIGSDIAALVPGDFDGDGREELAAAVGAWKAYDVRIFEAGPDGQLRLAVRRRFGHVSRMAALRAADGATLLALAKDETARSREAWAPGEPQGELPGIHLVRRSGDALVPVAYFPWHAQEGWLHPQHSDAMMVGDVDADGLQDLLVALESESRFATVMLLRQRPDGSFARAVLGGLYPHFLGNFDDDPADELVVTMGDGETARLCILGVAGEPVAAAPAPQQAAETPALVDPLLARTWARTESLAGLGLHGDAARALDRRISLTEHAADRRALRRRVAEMYEAAGESVRAGERFQELAEEGDVAAALRAVANYEQGLRMSEALRVAEAALRSARPTPAQASELRLAHARLTAIEDREARVELRFDGPLDPAWKIHEPLALRVDPVRGELVVDATADMQAIASLPIELTGQPLTLEFELDVERAEWGTQLAVTVRSAEDDELAIELMVAAGGGGGYLRRHGTFGPFWTFGGWETAGPAERSTHRMRATVLPAHHRMHVEEKGSHPDEIRFMLDRPLRPGPHTLVLRSTGNPEFGTQQIRGRIRRIALIGATTARVTEAAGTHARIAHALAAGEWRTALTAGDDDSAEARLWRGAALAELGRGAEAAAAFASLDPRDPVLRRHLRHLLRTRLPIFALVLRDAIGPGYAALLLESLRKKGELLDDELAAQRLAATADLEDLPDADDSAAAWTTRAGLLELRGGVWKSAGKLARAEADLAQAAHLLERASPGIDARHPTLATIELRRAELAAQDRRVDDALAAAGRALQRATEPEWMAERLQISPALRPIQDDPRWQALFVAPP